MSITKVFCLMTMLIAVAWVDARANSRDQEIIVASVLSDAVSADLEAAREKYLHKTVTIRGIVERTYTSRFLTPNVELVGDGSKVTFVLPYHGVTRGMGQLSNFKQGQIVTMQGRIVAISEEVIVLKESVVIEY